jgi:hypothetical protein
MVALIVGRLWEGWAPAEVIRELVGRGLDQGAAAYLVHAVAEELRRGGAL